MHIDDLDGPHPEDQPWNDAPADAGLPAQVPEPEPGEVAGDDGDEDDSTTPPMPGEYHRDTLSERLAEEEPEARLRGRDQDPEAGELVNPLSGGGDVVRGERGAAGDDPADRDLGAEDAAMHIVDEDRI